MDSMIEVAKSEGIVLTKIWIVKDGKIVGEQKLNFYGGTYRTSDEGQHLAPGGIRHGETKNHVDPLFVDSE